jgi:hypothetical protein
MGFRNLRIYHGPDDSDIGTLEAYRPTKSCITVSVGEVLPLLADAIASKRTWLEDFESDELTMSHDLYEVLQAYRHFRRPVA